MSNIQWNNAIIECPDVQTIKPASEVCNREHGIGLIVPNDQVEHAVFGRSLLKGHYRLLTQIYRKDQKNPGMDKMTGIPANCFDLDGFEIVPMETDNAALLLKDLVDCSDFLRGNLSQPLYIGWDLRTHKLSDSDVLTFLDQVAKTRRPDYLRFSESQGLICTIAKKTCAVKTALPLDGEMESDLKVLNADRAIKLAAQTA